MSALTCEVCGAPAFTVLQRRDHSGCRDKLATKIDAAAPEHPRCPAHLNVDAFTIDNVRPCKVCSPKGHASFKAERV